MVGCVQRWILAKLKHIQKHHESLSICPYVFACSTTWLVVYPIIYTIQGSYISRRCRYLAINSSCILHNRTGRCRKSVQALKWTLYSDMTSQFVTSTIIRYLKICNVINTYVHLPLYLCRYPQGLLRGGVASPVSHRYVYSITYDIICFITRVLTQS